MTILGCTGHQTLGANTTEADVRQALSEAIAEYASGYLVGLTSLAIGADQIFAHAILAAGGTLHVIIPSANYAKTFDTTQEQAEFAQLVDTAEKRIELPYLQPTEEAFMAAGRAVVDGCDLLLAVWDGRPAAGLGGTADVVAYADKQHKPVRVIWPKDATRE